MVVTSFLFSSSLLSTALAAALNSHFGTSELFERSALLSSGCSTTGTASCHNTSSVSNLCCFEAPGGLLLQTQFWDTNPSTGPSDSWTIHGLWPDHCDTTFSENCDSSRAYTGISTLLSDNGASSTLDFMQTHWVDINGQNEQFWEHEWATHGTCMSTLVPKCLPSGSVKGAEAVAFFETVVKLFQVSVQCGLIGYLPSWTYNSKQTSDALNTQTLPTFTWLSNEGITPSTTKTFTLSQLTTALKAQSGFTPSLDCTSGAVNQISWYFNLKGSVIDGTFVPIDAPEKGSCPSTGIKYPPKSGSSGGGTPTTSSSGGGPTSSPAPGTLPGKATIHAASVGGLLSAGTWSTQTLATYTLSGTTSSFTMTSSKGNCGVSGGTFACGSGVSLTNFSAVSSGGSLLLASGGSTEFSSDGVPSGSTVFTVFTGSNHDNDYTLSIIST